MPVHHFGEAELTLPAGWEDQSVTSYVLPRPDRPSGEGAESAAAAGGEATLVITRDYQSARALPPGEDFLERYADRQLAESARRLTRYEPGARGAGEVGGRRALVAEATWVLPNGWRVRQRQAFVRLGDRVVVFTLTARAEDFDRYAPVWQQATGGVRWRPGAGLPSVVLRQPPGPPSAPGATGAGGPTAA